MLLSANRIHFQLYMLKSLKKKKEKNDLRNKIEEEIKRLDQSLVSIKDLNDFTSFKFDLTPKQNQISKLADIYSQWTEKIQPMIELYSEILVESSSPHYDAHQFEIVFTFFDNLKIQIENETSSKQLQLEEKILALDYLRLVINSIILVCLSGILIMLYQSVKRLQILAQKAILMAEGNYDIRFRDHHSDEIGHVAQSINKMIEKILFEMQEKTLAQDSAQTKTRFLAIMSHEIRTPLNEVLSCAQLLIDEIKHTEHLKLAKTIFSSGNNLLLLINDVLDFSKIEAGKIELENNPFNIHQLVEEVANLFNAQATDKKVSLTYHYAEDVPQWVIGDVTRLRQVLTNLVSNALKFTKSIVHIELKVNKDSSLQFKIKDDGIGIAPESIPKLFKHFSQVDASTTRKFGGTGLGLAIVKGIIDLMNGDVWVTSTINRGSVFNVKMNLETCASTHPNQESELSVFDSTLALKYPHKILVAEDNSVNQMVIKKLLHKLGYEISIVDDGQKAVEAISKGHFDFIFMDQHMPQMDGLEATKIIRKKFQNKIIIYALTASTSKEDRDNCQKAGMDGFITKPINLQDLVNALVKGADHKSPKKPAA